MEKIYNSKKGETNSRNGKNKEHKGHTSAYIISILGLVFSVGAVLVAVNAQLHALETRTATRGLVNILEDYGLELKDNAAKSSSMTTPDVNSEEQATVGTADGADIGLPPLDQAFEPGTMPAENGTAVDINELISLAPSIILNDPSGGVSVGKAAMAVYQGWTFFKVAAIDLPPLGASEYYEVVLSEPAGGSTFTVGTMAYDASSSQAVLYYDEPNDRSSFTKVAVVREQAGYLSPGGGVLEGEFPENTNFTVTVTGGAAEEMPAYSPELSQLLDLNLSEDELNKQLVEALSGSQSGGIDAELLQLLEALEGTGM